MSRIPNDNNVIWYILYDNRACPNNNIVTYMYASQDNGPSTNLYIVPNHGSWTSVMRNTHSYVLPYLTIVTASFHV